MNTLLTCALLPFWGEGDVGRRQGEGQREVEGVRGDLEMRGRWTSRKRGK